MGEVALIDCHGPARFEETTSGTSGGIVRDPAVGECEIAVAVVDTPTGSAVVGASGGIADQAALGDRAGELVSP